MAPNAPTDPTKDKGIQPGQYGGGPYALSPAPDGTVWGTMFGFPGAVFRMTPGSNPAETALTEVFEIPWNNPAVPNVGFSPRGGDVDRNGVYWAALASGHMASFDRRKCKGPLNGPTATGQHCPEGWSFYAEPLPHTAVPWHYRAYFGQKDAQQLLLIRRMVRDIDFPATVVSVPTVREEDGLAMSSASNATSREPATSTTVRFRFTPVVIRMPRQARA